VNDQFAVPGVIALRSQSRLELPEHPRAALAQNRPRLPRDVFAKKLCRVDRGSSAQIAKRGYAMQGRLAEKVAAVLALHPAPDKSAGGYPANESYRDEARALSAHDIALRAVSAWAIVTPSASTPITVWLVSTVTPSLCSDRAALEQGHARSGLGQMPGGHGPDHAAADHDHVRHEAGAYSPGSFPPIKRTWKRYFRWQVLGLHWAGRSNG
jgi:hypothetical protein